MHIKAPSPLPIVGFGASCNIGQQKPSNLAQGHTIHGATAGQQTGKNLVYPFSGVGSSVTAVDKDLK